jgi:predicted TPR repeat methyltransferase
MARALALGTQDAMLFYHAGMIELALGDSAAARAQLERALATNPAWHPTQPARVRALLDTLSR